MNIFTVIGILVVSTTVGSIAGIIIGLLVRRSMEKRDNKEEETIHE